MRTLALMAILAQSAKDQDLRKPMDAAIEPSLDKFDLGSVTHSWGGKKFRNVYLYAPTGDVVIVTEDGKRLVITAKEVKRRAKR